MKTKMLLFLFLCSASIASSQSLGVVRTVFSQNFETAAFGANIEGIYFLSWNPAVWTKSYDTVTPISGSNSLKLEMSAIADDGNYQVRIDNGSLATASTAIDFKAGYRYRMTYKIRAAAATTIKHQFHKDGNPSDKIDYVSLVGGNVVETKTFTSPVVVNAGSNVDFAWLWLLRDASVATTVTIDDIVIEELNPNMAFVQDFEAINPSDISNNNIGGVTYSQWAPSEWTKSIETSSPVSGSKSLNVDVTNTSNGDWSLQMYLNKTSTETAPINFQTGYRYKMTYKIRSSNATTIKHIFSRDNMGETSQNVPLVGGNVVETKTFITQAIVAAPDGAGFKWEWWFGAPSVATTAVFDDIVIEKVDYEIAVSSSNGVHGSVSGGSWYAINDNVSLTATANAGYHFVNWTDGGTPVSSNSAYSFTATSTRTLVANFTSNTVNITTTVNTDASELNNCNDCDIVVGDGGKLVVNTSKTLKSITVSPTGQFEQNSDQTLTVTNGITLQSDANGTATMLNNGTYAGNVNVQQYLGSARNWYLSSPVSVVNSPSTGITRYYEYVEQGDNNPAGQPVGSTVYWKGLNTGTAMSVAKGYIAQASTETTVSFTGTANNGNITTDFNLTRDDAKGKGFNLVGNPYPSYLDWSNVFAANTNITNTFYYRSKNTNSPTSSYTFVTYNGGNDEFVSSNGTANTTITKLIPPMQAFWVRVKLGTASTTMSFTNAMREHRENVGNKFKAPSNNQRSRMRLQLVNGQQSDETLIYFDAAATNSFDNYDSPKMMNNSITVPDLYTKAGSENLVINGLSQVQNNMELPLGFTHSQGGGLKFRLTELSNFDSNTKLYLRDKLEVNEIELTPETEYAFNTAATTNNENRFSLIFKVKDAATALGSTEKSNSHVFVSAANQIVIVASEKSAYSIFNAVGQLIYNGNTTTNYTTANCKLQTGVYIVKFAKNQLTRVIIK